jgi:hypothetical protein
VYSTPYVTGQVIITCPKWKARERKRAHVQQQEKMMFFFLKIVAVRADAA